MADEIQLPEEPVAPQVEAEAPVEAPPEVQPEPESLPLRIGDREIQLDAGAVARLAEQMGFDNPAAVLNQLRAGHDATDIYKEARNLYRRARQPQQFEPAPQEPPQRPGYSQQRDAYGSVPQRQYQPPAQDDPIAVLNDMHQQMAEMRQQQQQLLQYTQAQIEQQSYAARREQAKLENEAKSAYNAFSKELQSKGLPEHKIPDMEYLLEEAESMGMFQSDLSVGEMYKRVHRMLYADQLAEAQAQRAVSDMRKPTARVTVPGPRPATPAAPPNPSDALSGMTARDALDFLPPHR